METTLYTITSSLHREMPGVGEDEFIIDIEKALGEKLGKEFRFKVLGEDFSGYESDGNGLIYIRTGGTEGIFKSLNLKGYIRILTSGRDNSLAAAMEILSYVRAGGGAGEILHGAPEAIAEKILKADGKDRRITPAAEVRTGRVKPLENMDLGGARLGVIGRPSDWLIASDVDYAKAKARLNVELIDIPIGELIDDIRKEDCEDLRSFAGSEAVYRALKALASRYALSGLTLRCFDLLDSIGNTGCLALARLNAEGIVSSCEGDIPALLTMMIAEKEFGKPGFQCNLSRICGDELLFAHCTVPLSMVKSYTYATHFESGIGTAIKGELPTGPATILKVAPDLESIAEIPVEILRNTEEPNLCRTQIIVKAEDAADYFLRTPLANHHIIAVR